MSDLRQLREVWDHLGRTDPLWAILSDPDKKGNRWDLEEFLETGRKEIAGLLSYVGSLGIDLPTRRALDFGCGVGRLTQALAGAFERVDGVDISPAMIERAGGLNRHGPRCRYHVNDRDDLSLFDDGAFDLVYSNVTLQHMEPVYALAYVREFIRVLSDRGVAVFQLPSGREAETGRGSWWRRGLREAVPGPLLRGYRGIRHRLRAASGNVSFDCYEVARGEVERAIEAGGGVVRDVVEDGAGGPAVVSLRYAVTRP